MNISKKLILLALFIYLPVQAMAWGAIGHRIVGQVADSYLTPKARLALQKILGNESLAAASTWADFIKSDPSYKYLTPWHYLDFEPGQSYEQTMAYLKVDTTVDAYTKLNFIMGQLKNRANLPHDKVLMYTRLLIHIIGDIHQPFHVGRSEDQGGNKIEVFWNFTEKTNMHSVWDSKLIESQQLSFTEYTSFINFTTAAQRAEWQKTDLKQWIYESNVISEKLYGEIKPGDKLGYNYIFDHIGIVNQQLLKGGVRLAGLLNKIFGA
ncbi:S1/P1 nuclease [Mucilaginibacter paludis]|uniref:S1/P1 nuclease n=1 Tax=Mucilaginibacter paludis DSM 18603 TaxID=714943 RepID=H1Y0S0_9SPHI|nr:S1/P1 nuclease [Mucilaginibacter paludis]EHQ28810.1 S1/P1 nuclease [Mucilaginibacter paludis DSM 18603]